MKYIVVLAIIATFAWAIGGAAIETDEVKIDTDEVKEAPVVPVEDINADCNQPKVTGRCFALLHRYAYNVDNRSCEEFVYGGCGANSNNFETKEECERKCNATKSEDSSTNAAPIAPAGKIPNDEAEKKTL